MGCLHGEPLKMRSRGVQATSVSNSTQDPNKDTINTAIGTLVHKGVIRREGNKQTGHWEVVK